MIRGLTPPSDVTTTRSLPSADGPMTTLRLSRSERAWFGEPANEAAAWDGLGFLERHPVPSQVGTRLVPDLDADVLWRTVLMGQAEDGAVRIEIRPSARRHRINDERIRYVIEHCPLPIDSPQWPGQTMFLGPDQHGNRLEVVGVEDDEGVLWIIHAMKLRSAYDDTYDEVNRHR